MSFYIISTQYYSLNTKYVFFEKAAFEPGLLSLRERGLVFKLDFFRYFCQSLIPECVYRPKDHFHCFVKNAKIW